MPNKPKHFFEVIRDDELRNPVRMETFILLQQTFLLPRFIHFFIFFFQMINSCPLLRKKWFYTQEQWQSNLDNPNKIYKKKQQNPCSDMCTTQPTPLSTHFPHPNMSKNHNPSLWLVDLCHVEVNLLMWLVSKMNISFTNYTISAYVVKMNCLVNCRYLAGSLREAY